jgi:hypothetical protein
VKEQGSNAQEFNRKSSRKKESLRNIFSTNKIYLYITLANLDVLLLRFFHWNVGLECLEKHGTKPASLHKLILILSIIILLQIFTLEKSVHVNLFQFTSYEMIFLTRYEIILLEGCWIAVEVNIDLTQCRRRLLLGSSHSHSWSTLRTGGNCRRRCRGQRTSACCTVRERGRRWSGAAPAVRQGSLGTSKQNLQYIFTSLEKSNRG